MYNLRPLILHARLNMCLCVCVFICMCVYTNCLVLFWGQIINNLLFHFSFTVHKNKVSYFLILIFPSPLKNISISCQPTWNTFYLRDVSWYPVQNFHFKDEKTEFINFFGLSNVLLVLCIKSGPDTRSSVFSFLTCARASSFASIFAAQEYWAPTEVRIPWQRPI